MLAKLEGNKCVLYNQILKKINKSSFKQMQSLVPQQT